MEEEYLRQITLEGDGSNLGEQVCDECGDQSGGVTDLPQGQVAQKEAHGGAQDLTDTDHQDNEAIAQQCHQVHGKE